MHNYLTGKYKSGVPELHFGYVDVRDVAKAHIYAVENEVEGRHILMERVTDMLSFSNIIKTQFGDVYQLPKSFVPKWLLHIIGRFFGMSRKYINRNVGIPIKLDNSKSKEKLNSSYIALEKTVKDMVIQIENQITANNV